MNENMKQMCDKYGVDYDLGHRFLDHHKLHVSCVRDAGIKIGVPSDQLAIHDDSKLSEWEFPFQAKRFGGDYDRKEWSYAWHHHFANNPHHWEYWRFAWTGDPTWYDGIVDNGCLEIPENYVREHIADWHGASKAYTGSWDISKWLNEHGPSMQFHGKTKRLIWEIMHEIGYTPAGNGDWSFVQAREL